MKMIKAININILAVLPMVFGLTLPAQATETMNEDYIQSLFQRGGTKQIASLSGNSIGSLETLALADSQEFIHSVSRRQNNLHSFSHGVGSSKVFFGEQSDKNLQKHFEKAVEVIGKQFGLNDDGGSHPQIWSTEFSRNGRVGSGNGIDSYDYTLSGLAGGVDVHAGESWNFGFAGGFSQAKSAFAELGQTKTSLDAYHAAAYATFEQDSATIDTNLAFNMFKNSSERDLEKSNASNIADAKGKGYQIAWTLSAMGHGKMHGFNITPVTGFTFASLHRGSMEEDGAGLLDLSSTGTNRTSFKPMLGMDIARSFHYRSRTTITSELYGIYRYEMLDAGEKAATHLENFQTVSLNNSTAEFSRSTMQMGASLAMKIGEKFNTKLQFDSDIQPGSHSYSGTLRLNYAW